MSTSTELQWNLDRLGQWSDPAEFEVTREKIAQFVDLCEVRRRGPHFLGEIDVHDRVVSHSHSESDRGFLMRITLGEASRLDPSPLVGQASEAVR